MKKVIIYSKPTCWHCKQAKTLLDKHGIPYEDRPIGLRYNGEDVRNHCTSLTENTKLDSVPQIIMVTDAGEERYVGGYSDLVRQL